MVGYRVYSLTSVSGLCVCSFVGARVFSFVCSGLVYHMFSIALHFMLWFMPQNGSDYLNALENL